MPNSKFIVFSDAFPMVGVLIMRITGGHWSKEESLLHINMLEMKPALFAIQIYAKEFFNCTVHLNVDNTSTLFWINELTASNENIFKMVKTFRDICIQKNIWVKASYIESKHKKVADKESRKVHDNLEWTLKQHVFEKVIKLFGKVTIDLFASHVNHKVERYYSYTVDTDSCGVDSFTKNWAKEIIYAFPPFAIISRMLKKIEKDEATGVTIVPHFTTQPWFSRLLRILIEDPLLLPKINMSPYFHYGRNNA